MELVTTFGKLYSKLGNSGFTRTLSNGRSGIEIPENLKEHVENLQNPTLSTVNSLFDGFIRGKHASHHEFKIEDDLHIKEILEYGHVEVIKLFKLARSDLYL